MTTRVTEPGIYDLTAEAYHADPCEPASLSSGGARKLITDVPARFWWERHNPPERTPALNLGSAAHEWLLEAGTFSLRYLVKPEGYDGRLKKWAETKAEIEAAEAEGYRILSHADYKTVKAMRDALYASLLARAAFQRGRPETSLFWIDPSYGIWCRCRPDYLPHEGRIFADYKTCESVRDDDLQRSIARYGYHQQAAWYADGIRALGIADDPIMVFVFQEKSPPHLVRCVSIAGEALARGRTLNSRAKAIFARCLETGEWPGYPDEITEIDLPGWEHARLERLAQAGAFDTDELRSAA